MAERGPYKQQKAIRGLKIDSEDQWLLKRYRWKKSERGYVYTTAKTAKNGDYEARLIHRVVMKCPADKVIDHINGNKLDNRKENLRICSLSENSWNAKLQRGRTSKFKGVCRGRGAKKWRGQIKFQNRIISFGLFDSEKEAAKFYDEVASRLHGEFASLNNLK